MKIEKNQRDILSFSDVKRLVMWDITVPYKEGSSEITALPLEKNGEEWKKVAGLFYLSMPNKMALVGIEKISNPILRENWEHELKMVKRKNNNQPNCTKLMWNGTGTTPPAAIYSNEKGWMVNYSTGDNLWGKGVYFAEDVSYVCGKQNNGGFKFKYAHKTKKKYN